MILASGTITLARIDDGAPGPAGAYRYMLLSTQTAKRSADGSIYPSCFTVNAYIQEGDEVRDFKGYFVVEEMRSSGTWETTYTSATLENALEYELNNVIVDEKGNYIVTDKGLKIDAGGLNTVSSVKISLFEKKDGQLFDQQSVLIISEAQELTTEDVFNLLTDGGRIQGLYRIGDQIYMNASYIRSGTYVVGGVNNERGTIEMLDASGKPVGAINNSGGKFWNMEIGDRVIVYNSTRSASVSIGFEPGTKTFYISGNPVTIPELHASIASIDEAVINNATLQKLIVSTMTCSGHGRFGTLSVGGKTSLSDVEVVGDIESVGDVSAGSPADNQRTLLTHEHQFIRNGARKLIFDNTGSVQHIRTMNGNNVLNGEVYLGSNASKFHSVYAANGTIQTSDERKKNIVGEFDERYLNALKMLKPILYRWKTGDQQLHAGFGAQSFQRALEESGIHPDEQFAVTKDEGEYSLSYAEIVPLLAYGMLDLMKKVEGGN